LNKLLLSLGLTSVIAFADMIPMGPINAGSGKVIGKDKVRIAFIHESMTKDEAYNGTKKVDNTKKREGKSKVTKLKMKYGVPENLELKMALPYISKQSKSSTTDYKNSGLGDLLLKANYQILNQKKGAPIFWSVSLGIKLPTADTNREYNSTVIPTMQLGSGSKDYYLETGVSKFFERSRIDGYLSYVKTSKGDNNYQYGDTKKAELGYAYSITKPLGVQAVLSYMKKAKHKQNGQELNHTGGSVVYITPGITYKINKNYDISAGYTKFIKANMNYDSSKKVGELVANDAFVVKFGMKF